MPGYDLIVRDGTLVTEAGVATSDVGVVDGRIAVMEPELAGDAAVSIDARGLHLFPGVIDAHVHLNEPGRTGWEGWATGSAALAAGGATTCFDMPLNAHPPTVDAASFDAKQAAAEASSVVDFGLWGGLVPGNTKELADLAARGVVGFKAFMSRSGTDDFPAADDLTLLDGMAEAARLGLPVAVHAENDAITAGLAARAVTAGQITARDYLASRPAIAEVEAIDRAVLFAEETGCALHIVHVSTGRGVARVVAARARGLDVTCETCPHYLVLTEDDLEAIGGRAKCAPPLRPAAEGAALWRALMAEEIAFVASDHSPAPADLKTGGDVFRIWGGIAGCQSTLPLLLTEGHHTRGMSLPAIAAVLSGAVARRFRLPAKGRLAVGADADLTLVNLGAAWTLTVDDLRDRHRLSPFVGRSFQGRVVRTLLRGSTTFLDGEVIPGSVGRLVRPESGTR
jgi:allantoinase